MVFSGKRFVSPGAHTALAPAHLPPESALEHFFDLRLIETKIRSCSLRQAREKVGNAAAAVRKQPGSKRFYTPSLSYPCQRC
jgi:hypothetical protein